MAANGVVLENPPPHESTCQAAASIVKQEEAQAPMLFRHSFAKLVEAGRVKQGIILETEAVSAQMKSVSEPLLLVGHPSFEKFTKLPKVQMILGSYGGTYKRLLKKMQDSRTQSPIHVKQGKEECDKFFHDMFSQMPALCMVAAEEMDKSMAMVLGSTWLWGYESKFYKVVVTPNGLAMFKYLAAGEISWLCFDCKALTSAMRLILNIDKVGLDQTLNYIQELGDAELKQLQEKGCTATFFRSGGRKHVVRPTRHDLRRSCGQGRSHLRAPADVLGPRRVFRAVLQRVDRHARGGRQERHEDEGGARVDEAARGWRLSRVFSVARALQRGFRPKSA